MTRFFFFFREMNYCQTLCCIGEVLFEDQTLCATCRSGNLNIVLDLDETLIHAVLKDAKLENCKPFCYFENYYLYKRPLVDHFLDICFKRYNVYIWTAGYKSYANFVLEHLLKPNQIPKQILTRHNCIIKKDFDFWSGPSAPEIIYKPLGKLKCNLARTVIIDDKKSNFTKDPLNGIEIVAFDDPEHQMNDMELLSILKQLDNLSNLIDVRNK